MMKKTTPRDWLVAVLLGVLTGTLVVTTLQLLPLSWLVNQLKPVSRYVFSIGVILLLLLLVRFGSGIRRDLKYWAARPFLTIDGFLISLALVLISTPHWTAAIWKLSTVQGTFIIIALAGVVGLLELARWSSTVVQRIQGETYQFPGTAEGELLDSVVGLGGMEPMFDLDSEDTLDRKPFVDTLEAAIRHPRVHPFTFGLDGPWGSGKTTILNALERRLETHGAIIVRFDAWNFREPERIVANYLEQLGHALRQAGGPIGLLAGLRRLGQGIAPLAGSRVGDALRNWLATGRGDSVRELLSELQGALQAQRRPVVALMDDLDRLERDELHAALRTLRIIADLPRVTHVLAYDRHQVARILFPEDASGRIARDYLGKIVHLELSLSTPTPESSTRILGQALQPLLDSLSKDDADRFVERLNSLPRQVFVEAMPTPREVRRVAGTTSLIWPRLKRDVNLFDLFVLQIIHARFPRAFGVLHAHPEWFTELGWSGDLWRISEQERWEKESKEYAERLWASEDPEEVNLGRLLSLIFPSMHSGSGKWLQVEVDARRERRICHPEVFPRYFQLSVPREKIAESSIEDLAARMKTAQVDTRVALMQRTVEEAARDQRVSALFEQWDLFLERLGTADQPLPFELIRDVALGLARAARAVPGEYNDPLNPSRTLAHSILHAVSRLESNQQISELLIQVIRQCPSFAVSGTLVFYAVIAEEARRSFPGRSLDEQAIRGEFDFQVRTRLAISPSPLFSLSEDDIGEVLYRTGQPHVVKEVFIRALNEHPEELPRVLGFAVKLGVHSKDLSDISVYHNGLADLHRQVHLQEIFEVTKRLPTEFWEDPHKRALVTFFRSRYLAVIEEIEKK